MSLDKEQFLNNAWVTLLARLAMLVTPVLLTILGVTLTNAVGSRDARVSSLEQRLSSTEARLSADELRLNTVETDQKRDGIDAVNLRSDLLSQLSSVARGQLETVSKLSALEATVQALKEQVGQFSARSQALRPSL